MSKKPRKPLPPAPALPDMAKYGFLVKIAKFFTKRPSDRTIRGIRIGYGLTFLAILAIYFPTFTIGLPWFLTPYEEIFRASLAFYGILPLAFGVTGVCLLRRKYIRMIEIIIGLKMAIVGLFFLVDIPLLIPTLEEIPLIVSSGANYADVIESKPIIPISTPPSSPMRGYLELFGFLAILSGISGKMVTQKCFRYGEKITKIRV